MKKKFLLLIINIMVFHSIVKGQEVNLLEKVAINEEEIESIATKSETEDDYSELFETRLVFLTHPLDINTATDDELQQLSLNDLQIKNLRDYITQYGEIAGRHELTLVEGFDSLLVTKLSPYITFKLDMELHDISLKNLLSRGKHHILTRYQTVLQHQKGYLEDTLSLQAATDNYLGDQSRILVKYGYNYYNRVRFGFLAEKDPGETLLPRNDTLKKGFDFHSFHVFYKGKGFVRNLAIGDYHLQFGQGLTMHSSFALSKVMSGALIQRRNSVVKPSTGSNESNFFRGAAITLSPLEDVDLTMFYSTKRLDGVVGYDSLSGSRIITSITETGLHRTARELQHKHAIGQQVFGGNIQARYRMFKVGATVTNTTLSQPYDKPLRPYNKYDFRGSSLLNFGMDFSILYRSLSLFGEVSASDNWAKACLIGGAFQPTSQFGASLVYRNYSERYNNFFSNAFSEGSKNNNEKGLYIGIYANLSRTLTITAFADHYKHDWLRYRVDAPSLGKEYNVYLSYMPNSRNSIIFRYNLHKKQINRTVEGSLTSSLEDDIKSNYRVHIETNPARNITLKSRIEYIVSNQTGENRRAQGFMIYQDVIYRNDKYPWNLNLRYALFDTDSYNERVYTYESDVLYTFSIPAYYDKGSRFYILGKYSLTRDIHFWLKYAVTFYLNKNVIGSGLDEIQGKVKSEVKAQIVIKL